MPEVMIVKPDDEDEQPPIDLAPYVTQDRGGAGPASTRRETCDLPLLPFVIQEKRGVSRRQAQFPIGRLLAGRRTIVYGSCLGGGSCQDGECGTWLRIDTLHLVSSRGVGCAERGESSTRPEHGCG